jgi:hypothetical protein
MHCAGPLLLCYMVSVSEFYGSSCRYFFNPVSCARHLKDFQEECLSLALVPSDFFSLSTSHFDSPPNSVCNHLCLFIIVLIVFIARNCDIHIFMLESIPCCSYKPIFHIVIICEYLLIQCVTHT